MLNSPDKILALLKSIFYLIMWSPQAGCVRQKSIQTNQFTNPKGSSVLPSKRTYYTIGQITFSFFKRIILYFLLSPPVISICYTLSFTQPISWLFNQINESKHPPISIILIYLHLYTHFLPSFLLKVGLYELL